VIILCIRWWEHGHSFTKPYLSISIVRRSLADGGQSFLHFSHTGTPNSRRPITLKLKEGGWTPPIRSFPSLMRWYRSWCDNRPWRRAALNSARSLMRLPRSRQEWGVGTKTRARVRRRVWRCASGMSANTAPISHGSPASTHWPTMWRTTVTKTMLMWLSSSPLCFVGNLLTTHHTIAYTRRGSSWVACGEDERHSLARGTEVEAELAANSSHASHAQVLQCSIPGKNGSWLSNCTWIRYIAVCRNCRWVRGGRKY